jgi:hypothetical protein
MLKELFEKIDATFGMDTFFAGMAFKFKRGIVMIDQYEDGFIAELCPNMLSHHYPNNLNKSCKTFEDVIDFIETHAI